MMGDNTKIKVLTKWVNSVLASANSPLPQVQDLVQEVDDGVILCTLVECISNTKLRYHKAAKERFQKNYNCKMAVNALAQHGTKLDGLDPFDIVDHNPAAVERIVWAIAKLQQLKASENEIIQWANSIHASEHKDIVKSWRDERYFASLLESFQLPSVVAFQKDVILHLESAYGFCEEHLGIPKLLYADDSPDLMCITLYLSYLRNYVLNNNTAHKSTKKSTSVMDTPVKTEGPSPLKHVAELLPINATRHITVVAKHEQTSSTDQLTLNHEQHLPEIASSTLNLHTKPTKRYEESVSKTSKSLNPPQPIPLEPPQHSLKLAAVPSEPSETTLSFSLEIAPALVHETEEVTLSLSSQLRSGAANVTNQITEEASVELVLPPISTLKPAPPTPFISEPAIATKLTPGLIATDISLGMVPPHMPITEVPVSSEDRYEPIHGIQPHNTLSHDVPISNEERYVPSRVTTTKDPSSYDASSQGSSSVSVLVPSATSNTILIASVPSDVSSFNREDSSSSPDIATATEHSGVTEIDATDSSKKTNSESNITPTAPTVQTENHDQITKISPDAEIAVQGNSTIEHIPTPIQKSSELPATLQPDMHSPAEHKPAAKETVKQTSETKHIPPLPIEQASRNHEHPVISHKHTTSEDSKISNRDKPNLPISTTSLERGSDISSVLSPNKPDNKSSGDNDSSTNRIPNSSLKFEFDPSNKPNPLKSTEKSTKPNEPNTESKIKVERDKTDRDKADRDKTDRDKADRDKADRDKADRDKAERDKAERDKADRKKVDRDTDDKDKVDGDKYDKDRKHKKDTSDIQKQDSKGKGKDNKKEDKDKKSKHKDKKDKDTDKGEKTGMFSWLKLSPSSSTITKTSKSSSSTKLSKSDTAVYPPRTDSEPAKNFESPQSPRSQVSSRSPESEVTRTTSPTLMPRRQTVTSSFPLTAESRSPDQLPRYWELQKDERASPSPTGRKYVTDTEIHDSISSSTEPSSASSSRSKRTRAHTQADVVTSYAAQAAWDPARREKDINHSKSKSFVDTSTREKISASPSSSSSRSLLKSSDELKGSAELTKQKLKSKQITSRVARSLSISMMQEFSQSNNDK